MLSDRAILGDKRYLLVNIYSSLKNYRQRTDRHLQFLSCIYGKLGSSTFLTESRKNSGNIDLLKSKPKYGIFSK